MSQISKALRKSEALRQNKELEGTEIVYLSDALKPNVVFFLVIIGSLAIIISTVAMVLTVKNLGTHQKSLLNLEKVIDNQKLRINGLVTVINKDQEFFNDQMRDLNFRMKKDNMNMKARMVNLESTDGDHYSDLKDAIIADKEKMEDLDANIKDLKQAVVKIPAADDQTKDLKLPLSGN
jgi:hypothetical protein